MTSVLRLRKGPLTDPAPPGTVRLHVTEDNVIKLVDEAGVVHDVSAGAALPQALGAEDLPTFGGLTLNGDLSMNGEIHSGDIAITEIWALSDLLSNTPGVVNIADNTSLQQVAWSLNQSGVMVLAGGLISIGNGYGSAIRLYDSDGLGLLEVGGWQINGDGDGALTSPLGYGWDSNGKLTGRTIQIDNPPWSIVIAEFLSDAGNSGTSATDIFSTALADAALIDQYNKFSAFYSFSITGSATATSRLKAYLAGNLVFDSGALGLIANGTWEMWIEAVVSNSDDTGAAPLRVSTALTTPGAAISNYTGYVEITGVDLTVPQILKVTATRAGTGAGSNQIVGTHGVVELKVRP